MSSKKTNSSDNSSAYDSELAFLKLGGYPILDFCNTKVIHSDHTEERLNTPREAERFFHDIFGEKVHLDENILSNIAEVRSKVRKFLIALITGEAHAQQQRALNAVFHEVSLFPIFRSIKDSSDGFVEISWETRPKQNKSFDLIFNFLFQFLSNAEIRRIKKCANPNCSHLFYDSSKNNSRSWCSMKSCGNIMKARAFYARKNKGQ